MTQSPDTTDSPTSSFCGALYAVLGFDAAGRPALGKWNPARALTAAQESIRRAKASLNGGFEQAPDWSFGTTLRRLQEADGLWNEAERLAKEHATAASSHARLAVLLAASAELQVGPAPSLGMISRPRFERLTDLSADQLQTLQTLADGERRRTEAFVRRLAPWVTRFNAASSSRPDHGFVLELCEGLDAIAADAAHRVDIQWRTANLLSRLASLVAAVSPELLDSVHECAARISQHATSPHWRRWLHEAVNELGPIPRSAGIHVVKAADLQARQPAKAE